MSVGTCILRARVFDSNAFGFAKVIEFSSELRTIVRSDGLRPECEIVQHFFELLNDGIASGLCEPFDQRES